MKKTVAAAIFGILSLSLSFGEEKIVVTSYEKAESINTYLQKGWKIKSFEGIKGGGCIFVLERPDPSSPSLFSWQWRMIIEQEMEKAKKKYYENLKTKESSAKEASLHIASF